MACKISLFPSTYIAIAAGLLLLPLDWALSAFAAALIHELSHASAIILSGGEIDSLIIRPGGALMHVSAMGKGTEAFCAAAGPAGSFFLLAFSGILPKLAVCGLLQGLFNLLPFYPLDGGRLLACLLPEALCRFVRLTAIAGLSLYAVRMLPENKLPLTVVAILFGNLLIRKIPCKQAR